MNYEETKDAVKGVKSGETCAFHPFDGAFAIKLVISCFCWFAQPLLAINFALIVLHIQ